jgi:co-chaperonin GroES (HSP10)
MSTATITRRRSGKRPKAEFPIDPYNFTPLRDGVLVRDLPEAPRKDGLVIIRENPELKNVVSSTTDGTADDYRREGRTGIVIACGPGRMSKRNRLIPLTVKPGDQVTYTAWNDLDASLPAGFRLIMEGDIWFVHEKAN